MDIAPTSDYWRLVPDKSGAERMHESFARVFQSISESTATFRSAEGVYLVCDRLKEHLNSPYVLSDDENRAVVVITKLSHNAKPSEIFENPVPVPMPITKKEKGHVEASKVH